MVHNDFMKSIVDMTNLFYISKNTTCSLTLPFLTSPVVVIGYPAVSSGQAGVSSGALGSIVPQEPAP